MYWRKKLILVVEFVKINKRITTPTVILAALIVIGAVLVFTPQSLSEKNTMEIEIKSGQGLNQVAETLEESGIIKNGLPFIWYSVVTGNQNDFKAGTYILSPRMSIYELVRVLTLGLSKSEDVVVRIFEGQNIFEIGKKLVDAGLIDEGAMLRREVLKKEGYLFPDTYRFSPPDKVELTVKDVTDKLEDNFKVKTVDVLSGLKESEMRRIIILASILEKEVRSFNDMRLVAGIIERRTGLGMNLELDATVAYGVCLAEWVGGKDCVVSQVNLVDNLKKNSEYNTYTREGLPPGPISNPGLKAIEAALNPLPSKYLFYLNARGTGETIFSGTEAEHAENRRKYLGL